MTWRSTAESRHLEVQSDFCFLYASQVLSVIGEVWGKGRRRMMAQMQGGRTCG